MQNSASEFDDSCSEYGVYSSSGRLLQGSERFKEAWEYAELAKQLDIKRNALYAEVRGSELLLGCSLLVKIRKGREERAVFMECLPKETVTLTPGWINRFYADAKNLTEDLQSIRYKVIGLWKEEDIFALSPPENARNSPDCPESLERKVLSGEKVSIWTADLSSGLFLLAFLISRFNPVLFTSFSLSLSLYPLKTDISAGPGESDPDFTLEGGELRASAVRNKKANLEVEKTTDRVQKEKLKEYKSVSNSYHLTGSDSSKTQEEPSKMNKTWKKKKIAGYACCFFLFLITGLLILSKAGLEPVFISLNVSKNNSTDFPPFLTQIEIRGDINPRILDLRDENTSKMRSPISSSPGGGSSNLSSVNLDDRADNVSPKLQNLITETNSSSEVDNAGAGSSTSWNEIAGNESEWNSVQENKSLENGIPENESTGYGIMENKSVEKKF